MHHPIKPPTYDCVNAIAPKLRAALRCVVFSAVSVLVSALIAGCGGGDSTSASATAPGTPFKGHAVIELNLKAPIPPDTLTSLTKVLQARFAAASVDAQISSVGDKQLAIDFAGALSENLVTELVVTNGVQFKEPQLNGTQIKCMDTSGKEFDIDLTGLQQAGDLPVCAAGGGRYGQIEWQPATAKLGGIDTQLSGSMIATDHVLVKTPGTGAEALDAQFNSDGTTVLQEVSAALVNYPLGVFLDDTLLMAPLIKRPITTGLITLAGASPDGMQELYAILKGGVLPAPVSLVSIGLK
jgi:preprotein translocase subunit SecD